MGTIVYINLRQTNTADFEAELADLAAKCESRSNAEFAAKSKARSRLREINAEIQRLVAIKTDAWSDQARYYCEIASTSDPLRGDFRVQF